jgi:hypothetical protein
MASCRYSTCASGKCASGAGLEPGRAPLSGQPFDDTYDDGKSANAGGQSGDCLRKRIHAVSKIDKEKRILYWNESKKKQLY